MHGCQAHGTCCRYKQQDVWDVRSLVTEGGFVPGHHVPLVEQHRAS